MTTADPLKRIYPPLMTGPGTPRKPTPQQTPLMSARYRWSAHNRARRRITGICRAQGITRKRHKKDRCQARLVAAMLRGYKPIRSTGALIPG